jgi:hypothetical protein
MRGSPSNHWRHTIFSTCTGSTVRASELTTRSSSPRIVVVSEETQLAIIGTEEPCSCDPSRRLQYL